MQGFVPQVVPFVVDGELFIDMWQEYYDKMTDEDKNRLPLKRIAFLGCNE